MLDTIAWSMTIIYAICIGLIALFLIALLHEVFIRDRLSYISVGWLCLLPFIGINMYKLLRKYGALEDAAFAAVCVFAFVSMFIVSGIVHRIRENS